MSLRTRSLIRSVAVAAQVMLAAGCGGSDGTPSSPTAPPLPLAGESANFRYYYSPGDTVQVERQEAFHAWAVGRLGVAVPRKMGYRKYTSRDDMGARTGVGNMNAYAEPAVFTIHTLWSWDNHETVHIYTALIGRPSDFFNEGIAVAFQTDPFSGDFEPRFNGEQVHDAARRYRQLGLLVLPLSRIVSTSDFRGISDSTLNYREAGSFVAFLITRFGIDRMVPLFSTSTRDDAPGTIRMRFEQAFGTTLENAEADWLAFVG